VTGRPDFRRLRFEITAEDDALKLRGDASNVVGLSGHDDGWGPRRWETSDLVDSLDPFVNEFGQLPCRVAAPAEVATRLNVEVDDHDEVFNGHFSGDVGVPARSKGLVEGVMAPECDEDGLELNSRFEELDEGDCHGLFGALEVVVRENLIANNACQKFARSVAVLDAKAGTIAKVEALKLQQRTDGNVVRHGFEESRDLVL
jgi:hypothetical protein